MWPTKTVLITGLTIISLLHRREFAPDWIILDQFPDWQDPSKMCWANIGNITLQSEKKKNNQHRWNAVTSHCCHGVTRCLGSRTLVMCKLERWSKDCPSPGPQAGARLKSPRYPGEHQNVSMGCSSPPRFGNMLLLTHSYPKMVVSIADWLLDFACLPFSNKPSCGYVQWGSRSFWAKYGHWSNS